MKAVLAHHHLRNALTPSCTRAYTAAREALTDVGISSGHNLFIFNIGKTVVNKSFLPCKNNRSC